MIPVPNTTDKKIHMIYVCLKIFAKLKKTKSYKVQ